jgi:glycerophosphoryl diester phosphodiesterase
MKMIQVKILNVFYLGVTSIVLLSCAGKKLTNNPGTLDTSKPLPNGFANKVIAHRGAFKNTGVPENSIASLKAAIQMGCGGSEFDIHMTADSVLVINHDHDLQGMNIETSTYQQLLEKSLSNGEKIPTLENYLREGLGQNKTKLVAEIKASKVSKERSLALTNKVVDMVKRLNGEKQVVYISFDYDVLKRVKELDASAPVQYLNGDVSAEQLKTDGFDVDYHYTVFQRNPGWIKNAKSLGIVVNAWTVNRESTMDSLLSQDIDFITTDQPELLLKKLSKND